MRAIDEVTKFSIGFFLTILIWWVISVFVGKNFLPDPNVTFRYLFSSFFEKGLYFDLYISFRRVLVSLILALIIGFPVGIISGVNKRVDNLISPLLYFLFPLPKIVFLPIFFVLSGINENTRISLLFFILVFQIIVNVRDGAKNISSEYVELFNTMGAKKSDYLKIYVPFSLPAAFTSIRISVGLAIAVLFITENFVADNGLGFIILNAMELRNYPEMYSGIVLMSFLGYFFYFITDFFERKICFWNATMIE